MTSLEQQEEEREVLESIYDGDDAFKQLTDKCFQYKIGEDQANKSFLLEISWPEDYPDILPTINLSAFYNKHLCENVKSAIVRKLNDEADALLGCAMTYTLVEYAKENAEDLLAKQVDQPLVQEREADEEEVVHVAKTNKVRKEQLTKSQKRKLTSRVDVTGELPRGHDWVDVVKHLCQTGQARASPS